MSGTLLTYLAIYVSVVGALIILSIIVGSFIYDLRANKSSNLSLKEIKSAKKPIISVLLTASNDQTEMESTLRSILASSYKKIEVIVAHNTNNVTSKLTIKNLVGIKHRGRISIRSSSKYKDDDQMMLAMIKQHAKGAIIFVIKPGYLVDENSIENAVKKLISEPTTVYLKPKLSLITDTTLLSRMENYFGFIANQVYKLLDLLGYLRTADKVFMARRSYFMTKANSRNPQTARYTSNFKITKLNNGYISSANSKLKPLRLVLNPMHVALGSVRSKIRVTLMTMLLVISVIAVIASPFILAYFVYLAAKLHEPTLLIASAIALSALLISSICSDENIKFITKLKYILGMPISFYWFYLSLVLVSIKFAASFILEIISHIDIKHSVESV
jgi:hypothetical protein